MEKLNLVYGNQSKDIYRVCWYSDNTKDLKEKGNLFSQYMQILNSYQKL